MKQKLTYCLLAVLLPTLAWGECEVSVIGYHGGYGAPYDTQTMDYVFIDPATTHSQKLPNTPDSTLTVYGIDAGRETTSTPHCGSAALFTLIPTLESPYLAIWYAVEMATGSGGHSPVFGGLRVYDPNMTPIGCKYDYSGLDIETHASTEFINSGKNWSSGINFTTYYCPWSVQLYDLSAYIGRKITIEAFANTCSTANCTSEIYVAFNCFARDYIKGKQICSTCDNVTLEAPTGFTNYEWHKGSPQGSLMGANEPLVVQGEWNITSYYCTIHGACGELSIPYTVVDAHTIFDYDIHCGETADTVYLNNLSYMQERLVPYTKTPCEGVLWDFGDGRTSTDPNLPYIVYTEGGEYTISLKAGNADLSCAKTISKTLTVCPPEPSKDSIPLNPMPLIPITDSIDSVVCFGTTVEWRGKQLTKTDIYRDTTLSVIWGIDSIYHILNLQVSAEPVEEQLKDTSSCTIIPFVWKGHLIETDTLIFDTIWTVKLGCDSIYSSLQFTLKYPSGSDTTAYVCNNDLPFIWHGKEAADGDTIILTNTVGCDSIVTLHLTIYQSGTREETQTICDKQLPFLWKDKVCTEAGDYVFDTLTTHGCDSTITLHLIVSDHAETDTTAYICYQDLPFIWHGKEATDGDTIILINTAGCDSIVTVPLTVYQSDTWEETQTICDKQLPFRWKDKVCTEAGDYVFDTLTTHGCDSTITLHLIVSDHAEADTVAYVCYQDLPFIWHGKEAVDGDTVILTNAAGCDSIVTLRLTISAPMTTQTVDTTVCDTLMPYTWRGHTFPVVGEFRDTLRNVHGCDSLEFIYTLDTFHCERPLPPPVDSCLDSLVYRKWQDVLFCDNGRHEFVAYQWFRDNISLAGETNQYLYNPGGFGTNEYFVEVTYAGGKKRRTCPLSFDDTPRSADTYARVQTLVRRGERLHIEISDQSAEVDILTILGQQLSHFSIGKTADLDVQLPSGVYVLILKGEQVKRTTKIMVE
ncbi:MAG: hypothetical protein KBS40_04115 [Bacteroidales bacterium]|nr:hypothetical protein [Bacteroidales bacterium]